VVQYIVCRALRIANSSLFSPLNLYSSTTCQSVVRPCGEEYNFSQNSFERTNVSCAGSLWVGSTQDFPIGTWNALTRTADCSVHELRPLKIAYATRRAPSRGCLSGASSLRTVQHVLDFKARNKSLDKTGCIYESTSQGIRRWKIIVSVSIILKSTLVYGRLILQGLHYRSTV
jgi:hypothetical protein